MLHGWKSIAHQHASEPNLGHVQPAAQALDRAFRMRRLAVVSDCRAAWLEADRSRIAAGLPAHVPGCAANAEGTSDAELLRDLGAVFANAAIEECITVWVRKVQLHCFVATFTEPAAAKELHGTDKVRPAASAQAACLDNVSHHQSPARTCAGWTQEA